VSAPGYGTVPTTGLGLSASMVGGQSVSSASKMSVNTTSGKMVPGMPPGVASVLPAQYMIGANAAAAGEIDEGTGRLCLMQVLGE
jgi:hypothetical protein